MKLISTFSPTLPTLLKFVFFFLPLVSTGIQGQENGATQTVPELRELRQQAMGLEQAILIAPEEEREMVAEQAEQLLASFDRRIEALTEDLARRQDEMNSAARRYSSELMQALGNQRQDVSQWLTQLRSNESETWDHIVYNFTRAYESFYETFEDVESSFGLSE